MNNVHESERVTAFHEAAHFVAAWIFDRPLEVVSIRAGQGFNGISMLGPADTSGLEVHDVPAILQPNDLWRYAIASTVISLAGPVGAELAGYRPDGYVAPTADELIADARIHEFVGLESRHVDMLEDAERKTKPFMSDEESAASMSAAAMGEAVAGAFMGFMWAATRELVFSAPFSALVGGLVPELIEHKAVPGHRAEELFDAVGVVWKKGKKRMGMTPTERAADLARMRAEDDLRFLHDTHAIDDEEYARRRGELEFEEEER